jgi:hypothetical protein
MEIKMKMRKDEYSYPIDGRRIKEQFRARQLFFSILEERAPQTLNYLKDEVLPIYIKLFPKDYSSICGSLNLMTLRWKRIEAVNVVCKGHLTPLIEIINKWSEKFNLVDPWIKDKILKTLADWRKNPLDEKEELKWFGIDIVSFTHDIKYSFFITKEWDPTFEPWGKAKERMTYDFKNFLDNHKKKKEELAKKIGLKQNRKKRKIEQYLNWLIDYQIFKKSSVKLRDAELKQDYNSNVELSTITRAIKSTAELLGITLRTKIDS